MLVAINGFNKKKKKEERVHVVTRALAYAL